MAKIRLQKFLSQAGFCSRRAAEVFIANGRVQVNGQVAKIGTSIDPDKDQVLVNGKPIEPKEKNIYLVLNKPTGYTTTRFDRHAEKTIYELLPAELRKKVWPVGRLDKDSCGLLIMTNDGELTQELTHPSFEHEKEYLVRFIGQFSSAKKTKLETGVILENKKTAPCQIVMVKDNEIKITIHEGQKRQVREMLKTVSCRATFLERLREGKLTLGNLKTGQYRFVDKKEII
ncbi:MAG: pseudouridine synthase [Patescibacteria group bacterium]